MFPMLEMSGSRAKFISEVLYIYNAANPINDCKVDRQLQRSLETAIRIQKRYDRLKSIPSVENGFGGTQKGPPTTE
jgi:hypothetical protein